MEHMTGTLKEDLKEFSIILLVSSACGILSASLIWLSCKLAEHLGAVI